MTWEPYHVYHQTKVSSELNVGNRVQWFVDIRRRRMAVAPARAIFIVSFNIIRVLCRKYGLYLFVGCLIILFQGFSGYYVLRLGSDNTIRDGRGPSLPDKAEVFEVSVYFIFFLC